jgi:integrase
MPENTSLPHKRTSLPDKRASLTVRGIETLKAAASRREIPDRLLPGLYLVVQPSGAKSWAVRYRHRGRPRKHTLGAYPAIDLKSARDLARGTFRAVAEGRDPGQEKAAERQRVELEDLPSTIGAVAAQFLDRHYRNKRPRTREEVKRLLDLHVLPYWRNRLVGEIAKRDVIAIIDRVIDKGFPVAANRCLTVIKTMFTWARERDIVAVSPAQDVKKPTKEQSRERVLSSEELRAVLLAADQMGGPFGALVKLLCLTGARRDEVAEMPWSEIDLEARIWSLPAERVKTDNAHQIALSDLAIATLKTLPRLGKYVLVYDGDTPASDFSKKKRKLDALLPEEMRATWTLHDLRRTMASHMARLGIALPTIERILNHVGESFGGIAGVYQKHDFADEQRIALEAWGRHIEALVAGETAKFLPLRKA